MSQQLSQDVPIRVSRLHGVLEAWGGCVVRRAGSPHKTGKVASAKGKAGL